MKSPRLATTAIGFALALVFVVLSGGWIARTFYLHNYQPCRGFLQAVSVAELGHGERKGVARSDVDVAFEVEEHHYPTLYKHARLVWHRGNVEACSDLALGTYNDASSPAYFDIERDAETGLYLVLDSTSKTPKTPLAVFRKAESSGRRFTGNLADPHNLSMLIFLVACGALAIGAFRMLQAAPYEQRMHAWKSATLAENGAVESETGEMLGRMDRPYAPGPVILDPAVEAAGYRDVAVLTRKMVGRGSHEQWLAGTLRQLRDARALTFIASAATALAIAAHLIEG